MPSDEAHGVRAALLIEHFRRFLCDARREGDRIGIIEQSAPFSDRYITSSSPTLLRRRRRGGGNVVAAAVVTGSGEREEREPDLVLRAPAWRAGGG